MLVVVVLVPIVIMILAVSLERFEALTTRVTPAPRAATPASAPIAGPTTPTAAPATTTPSPAASHLRLVPGSASERAPEPAGDLRRAS